MEKRKFYTLLLLCLMSVNAVWAQYAFTVFDANTGTLTYYYDTYANMQKMGGEEYDSSKDRFKNYAQNVKKAVIDASMKDAPFKNLNKMFFGGPGNELSNMTEIIGLENLNTQRVIDMTEMFYGCKSLKSLDVSKLNTGNVEVMSGMFEQCASLKTLDLSKFSTLNVKDMSFMFDGCKVLQSVDLSSFNTQNVNDMNGMFYDCENLTVLNIAHFDMQSVTIVSSMFGGCKKLKTIYCNDDWNTIGMDADETFEECYSLVGGNGTRFDPDHTYIDYARPDGGEESPGYFTVPVHCTAPTDFQATEVTANTITLTWTPGADETEWLVMYYMLDENGDQVSGSYTDFETDEPTYTFSQLHPNTQYQLIVAAICGDDDAYLDLEDYLYITTKGGPEIYAAFDEQTGTLTYYYDKKRGDHEATVLLPWKDKDFYNAHKDDIVRLLVDPSFQDAPLESSWGLFHLRANGSAEKMPSVEKIDGLEYINTETMTDLSYLFARLTSIEELNLTVMDLSHVTITTGMFWGCNKLKKIICDEDLSNVTDGKSMFLWCTSLVGGLGTECDGENNIGAEYARPDEEGKPGYFTSSKQGLWNVQGNKVQSTKVLKDGVLLIERNGKLYNAQGVEIQ